MKRIKTILMLLGAFLVMSCEVLNVNTGGNESVDVETRVASILTEMPAAAANPLEHALSMDEATQTAIAEGQILETRVAQALTETQAVEAVGGEETTETLTPITTVTTTATVTPYAYSEDDPRNVLGTPHWTDTMDNDRNWPSGYNRFTDIYFFNSEMILTTLTDVSGWRLAMTKSLSNFYLEMTVTPSWCTDTDSWGIIFRVPVLADADRGYLFGIDCEGRYYLKKWDGKYSSKGKMTTLVYSTPNSAILSGPESTNRLGVMATGSQIMLFVNGVWVDEVRDSAYSAGYFGPFANSEYPRPLVVRVDEVNYWENYSYDWGSPNNPYYGPYRGY